MAAPIRIHVLILGLFTLAAQKAHAGGILTTRFGADHGSAQMSNPYAVHYNPAALGGMEGTQITADGTFAYRLVNYTRYPTSLSPAAGNEGQLQNPDYVNGNSGKATLRNFIVSPFVGFASDLGTDKLRVGAAMYVPFGGVSKWDKVQAPPSASGASDGVQRWHNMTGQQTAMFFTLAGAYKLSSKFSVGLALHGISHKLDSVRARNPDGSDDMFSTAGTFGEGRSIVNVSGFNVGATVGVFVVPDEKKKIRLGLSYVSQPGFGQSRLKGTFESQLASEKEKAKPQDVDLLMAYPDVLRLAGAYRASDTLDLRMDLQYERWSVHERQCVVVRGANCDVDAQGNDISTQSPKPIVFNIPRNWQDSFRVRAGVGYFAKENIELFGSVGLGTSAIPKKSLDATYIDSTNLFATLGGRYAFLKNLSAALSYNVVHYMTVDVAPGTSDVPVFNVPSRSPNPEGKFSSQIHFLNANVTLGF